jgi:hypothetical protein
MDFVTLGGNLPRSAAVNIGHGEVITCVKEALS